MTHAENFTEAYHSGESSRNSHRNNDLFLRGNAAVLRRVRVLPDRAKLISPFCLPEVDPNRKAHEYGQQKSHIQWSVSRYKWKELIELRYRRCIADRSG